MATFSLNPLSKVRFSSVPMDVDEIVLADVDEMVNLRSDFPANSINDFLLQKTVEERDREQSG